MAVYQRGKQKVWYVDFEVSGRRIKQPIAAKNQREAKGVEEAMKVAAKEAARRGHVNGSMTLDDAIDRYLKAHLKPKAKPKALEVYLYMLDRIRKHFGKNTKLEKIATKPALTAWRDELLKQGLVPGTVRRYLNQLNAVLNAAVEWGHLDMVPKTSTPKVNDSRLRYLRDDAKEEVRLWKASPRWLRDVIVFAVETGARKTNVLELTWDQVDLDRKPRGIVRFKAEDTKQGDHYSVPLSDRCKALLKRLKKNAPKGQPRVFLRPNPKTVATVNSDGTKTKPLEPIGEFKRAFATVVENAKLEDFHFHDLRHTFASRLVMKGVSLYEVSKLMGHKSIRMTERYAHLHPDRLDTAIDALSS